MSNIQLKGDATIVISDERVVYINGQKISFHPNMKGNSITTINGEVFVDGFQYVGDQWRRTLKALYHKWF